MIDISPPVNLHPALNVPLAVAARVDLFLAIQLPAERSVRESTLWSITGLYAPEAWCRLRRNSNDWEIISVLAATWTRAGSPGRECCCNGHRNSPACATAAFDAEKHGCDT
jgi:hypothetical protein